jgi:zinc transporter ZupT
MRSLSLSIGMSMLATADAHAAAAQHGHGDWEWAGSFDTPDSHYVWQAQAVEGVEDNHGYVDPSMKMVIFSIPDSTEESLHAVEEEAGHSFGVNCTEVDVNEYILPTIPANLPGGVDYCYELHFAVGINPTSSFFVNTTGVAAVAIFAQHVPVEFERDMHYFKDVHGDDIEPVHELPEEVEAEVPRPWGIAIGAAIIVNLVTFTGVVFVVPGCNNLRNKYPAGLFSLANAFASGALLASAFFLMLHEATHLLTDPNESFSAFMWGALILTGFITSSLLEVVVHSIMPPASSPDMANTKDGIQIEITQKSKRIRVLSGVLVGDFIHNLVDGILIGFAFIYCDQTVGWSIAASSVYHEFAQEVSDYLVLTDPKQGNLSTPLALLWNFLSGTSVIWGAIIMVGMGDIDIRAQGLLLAFGGGVYIQIGATECMNRVHGSVNSNMLRIAAYLAFVAGAISIGLVLYDHEHCVPAGAEDAHGHGHGHGH